MNWRDGIFYMAIAMLLLSAGGTYAGACEMAGPKILKLSLVGLLLGAFLAGSFHH